jgi:A/G-specific adenine glycosylase
VLCRLFGIEGEVKSPAVQERLWDEAGALGQGEAPGDLNQALMELGALVCTPRAPHCGDCPWRRRCRARAAGTAESLPRKTPKKAPLPLEAAAGWLERRGRVLVVQRPPSGLLAGMWELPGGEVAAGERPADALLRHFAAGLGLGLGGAEPLGSVEHVFSHRRLRLHVFRCKPATGRLRRRGWDAHRWVSPAALDALAQGGPLRKARARVAERAERP